MSEQTNVAPHNDFDSTPTSAIATANQVAKVDKPAGGLTVVDTDNANQIDLEFDLGAGVKVLALDVDLVIAFPDGTKIILPNLGMKLAGADAPKVSVLGHLISKQMLLAQISDVSLAASHDMLAPPTPAQTQTTTVNSQPQASETPAPQAQPASAAVDVGPGQSAKIVSTKATDTTPQTDNHYTSNNPPAPIVPTTVQLNTTSSSTPMPTPSKTITTAKSDLIEGTIEAALYNYDKTTQKALATGGTEVDGAIGAAGTSTSKTFGSQSATRSLSGSDAADLIYAEDPSLEAVGHSVRVMTGNLAVTAGKIVSVQVYGFPANVIPPGLTGTAGTYDLPVIVGKSDSSQATFSLALNYAIPQNGAVPGAQGFYSKFTLSFFITYNDGSQNHTALVTQEVGIRDRTGADDTHLVDKATGDDILVLWANPPGASVDAGNGDDTVVSGAGADTLHGGAGINTLSYERSLEGVTVDLAAHSGSSGFARGDVFDGFQKVIGSAANDSISGDSSDNTLTGGAGADTLRGGGGSDVADYSTSSAGVTVDLSITTPQHGGDAEGDVLYAMSGVTGSATAANTLRGTTSANAITGGAGNDSIDGRGGADVIKAGGGDDTIVTYGNEALIDGGDGANMLVLASGVSVDMVNHVAYTSTSTAQLVNIENIDARGETTSATINGDTLGNIIFGGGYDDSLDGLGGQDGIYGNAGNDTIVYHRSEARLDGGDGIDTLKIAAGTAATINLAGGSDQSSNDSTIVVNFENVDGTATAASLVVFGTSGDNSKDLEKTVLEALAGRLHEDKPMTAMSPKLVEKPSPPEAQAAPAGTATADNALLTRVAPLPVPDDKAAPETRLLDDHTAGDMAEHAKGGEIAQGDAPKGERQLRVVFRNGAVQIEADTANGITDYVKANKDAPGFRVRSLAVRGVATPSGESATESRRRAYYRALLVRQQLLSAGIPAEHIDIEVRDGTAADVSDTVRVIPGSPAIH